MLKQMDLTQNKLRQNNMKEIRTKVVANRHNHIGKSLSEIKLQKEMVRFTVYQRNLSEKRKRE